MKRSFLLILLFGTLLEAKSLSLQSCIEKTLKNHPDEKSFALSLKQSEKEVDSAKSAFHPQIAVHLEYDPLKTYVISQNGRNFTKDDTFTHEDIVLSQKIWDFSKTKNRIEAQKIEKDISKLSLEEIKNKLRLKVEQVYDLMLLQKQMINLRRHDLKAKQALYRQAVAMQKQGLKTKIDAMRFESEVFSAKEALSLAVTGYDKAKNSLEFLIGEKISKHTVLKNELKKIERLRLKKSKKDFLRKQLLNNPSLKKVYKSIEKSQKLYNISKNERYGSIDATAMATHEETLWNYDTQSVAIKAQIPLYQGGKLKAQAQKAKIAQIKARTTYASALLQYKEQLEALFIDLRHIDVSIKAKKKSIKATKEALRLIEGRYKVGLISYLEVLDALTLYKSSQTALISAYAQKSDILYQIKSLTGVNRL